MKPFFILLITFGLSLLATRIFKQSFDYRLSGRIALAIMLLFTSIGHFKFPEGMALMLPYQMPYRIPVIYFTGVIEIIAAIGILIPNTRWLAGVLLIVFFILILPSNIFAAFHHVNLEKATFDGSGPSYLWFRIPFQILLIWWTYFFVVK